MNDAAATTLTNLGRRPPRLARQSAVQIGWFICAALLFAVLGGFSLAGHMSFVQAFGYPLGSNFTELAQAHGHLQLVGWAGLLIMGVSMRLLPPLLSRPAPKGASLVALFVSGGLLLRSVAQITLPYFGSTDLRTLVRGIFALGAISESAGFLLYAAIIASTVARRSGSLINDYAVRRLLPYLACMTTGAILIGALNSYASLDAVLGARDFIAPALSLALADIFIYLLLLPAALLFSVKLLPLFLGLREPRWPVGTLGTCYFILAAAVASFRITALLGLPAAHLAEHFTLAAVGAVLIAFVAFLDVLTRYCLPERLAPLIERGALRGRGRLPDRGEFGHFEWHIYAAYCWLLLAAIALLLQPFEVAVHTDTIRHALLLGFGTNLIFGVGYRLLPGLLAMRLARPAIVAVTAFLLNAAALGRIVPKVLPGFLEVNASNPIMKWSFGLSGSVALIAVLLFGLNLSFGWLFNRSLRSAV